MLELLRSFYFLMPLLGAKPDLLEQVRQPIQLRLEKYMSQRTKPGDAATFRDACRMLLRDLERDQTIRASSIEPFLSKTGFGVVVKVKVTRAANVDEMRLNYRTPEEIESLLEQWATSKVASRQTGPVDIMAITAAVAGLSRPSK